MTYAIAEAAHRSGLSIDTLRYYERIQLIDPPARDSGGRRAYTDEDLASGPHVYGAMKVGCEQAVTAGAESSVVVRPGLIVGPGDRSGRFSYWPRRIADGGASNLCRRRQIAIQQRRLDAQGIGIGIEPVRLRVRRQHRGRIDLDGEQVAQRAPLVRGAQRRALDHGVCLLAREPTFLDKHVQHS